MGRCYLLDLTKFLLDGAIYFFYGDEESETSASIAFK